MSDQVPPSSPALLEEDKIKEILVSDSSFSILAQRLKQSIRACEEFSSFISRKCHAEQKYSKEIGRIVNHCDHSIVSNNVIVGGSFIESLKKVIHFDEKVNGVKDPYITALQTMADQLEALVQHFTMLRKQLKERGNKAEKEVMDAISMAKKARNRYFNLCTELEKVRSADKNQTKITLQGRKTNSQQDEDLKIKIKDAEDDYNKKANASQRLKNSLITRERPKITNQFKNLIIELDYAMQIQLQKYSIYTESLVVGMGNQINPINGSDSMKKIATNVDLEKNLYYYLKGSTQRKNESLEPVEFKRHPIVGGVLPKPATKSSTSKPRNFSTNSKAATSSGVPPPVSSQNLSVTPIHNSTFNDSTKGNLKASEISTGGNGQQYSSLISSKSTLPPIPTLDMEDPSLAKSYNSLDPGRSPQLKGPRPFDSDHNDSTASFGDNSMNFDSTNGYMLSTDSLGGHLFGLPLEALDLNEEAVPLFVIKCIELIEKYGSNTEGIYRLSPNKATFDELKHAINMNPQNLSLLEPKNPNNVSSEYVYMISSLLKRFFASLPEPLLTNEQRDYYLQAAELSDKMERQTKVHQLIFELPDSNYFTLRDLLGHFRRLSQLPTVRMDSKNLSIVWANNLLGGDFDSKEELEIQSRVVEDLIEFAPSIFTYEDEEGE
ncbi:RHO GTPase-activating protein RGD1 [Pichia kudriavzevii]|uniref:RHO GTPase-activating protein RGD1 n=1 Tax=Pichia kudriavzevii TaxID=4909 RepID=A0A1V2LI44_PICKU|nr:RHO GTPase-activating protein RGD1 [Pichia kudriavzevii]ONH70664.1 RHO GTPase-activating protein RGD1 [Pichia kudriavzevii]ONH71344.1 RHO GTPase-activating protein RGD1 [Pichia kudriavzevii]ONH72957.1 RHO GTPase-activating protein RGD1 [Pichia kudriavzevii]